MEIPLMIMVIVLAFCCEYLDSSLGMGYGTILAPALLIFGLEPLLVIPSILLSQSFTGFSASTFHHNMKNCDYSLKDQNVKIIFIITSLAILITIATVIIAIQFLKIIICIYVGLLVILMGIILLSKKRFSFSWKKIQLISILSAFNKGISGGGFGPIITAGQVISGRKTKESIGVANACEVPICIMGFLTYYLLTGFSDFTLASLLCIGGILATPIGALGTKKIKEEYNLRRVIGLFAIGLGIFIFIRVFLLKL